jgi:ribosomal protein L15
MPLKPGMSCRIRTILGVSPRPAPRWIAPFVRPTAQCFQYRYASILSSLADNPGAINKRIRRGRGPGSGKGKTSGRGHKGQKQHGKVPAGFTGGQKTYEEVHGTRGFENVYATRYLDSQETIRSDIRTVFRKTCQSSTLIVYRAGSIKVG